MLPKFLGVEVTGQCLADTLALVQKCLDTSALVPNRLSMVWYGMVNVDLYSTIVTKVSNVLNTLVSGEKPGFQALSKGLIVLLSTEVIWQRVTDHTKCSASNSG